MEKYQSKKDETILTKLVSTDDKCGTVMLEFITGEKIGKSISVSKSTLQRWWKKVKDGEVEQEVFHVEVETESGETAKVDIDPEKLNIDTSQYNFNPADEEKRYIEKPKTLKYIEYLESSPYPDMEELVDLIVSWGGDVKRFGWFITLTNKTRIIIRVHKKIKEKSCFEVRMKEDVSKEVKSFNVKYDPKKSGQCAGVDYVVTVSTLDELETLVREISQ